MKMVEKNEPKRGYNVQPAAFPNRITTQLMIPISLLAGFYWLTTKASGGG